jgi:N-acetylneuraminic acid mutarotase
MIVWGGWASYMNTGGRYNPTSNSWQALTTTGAPTARKDHSVVWTGAEMIVFGGSVGANQAVNTGGAYDPSIDTWNPINSGGSVPSGRQNHTAIWTGEEMVVFGGGTTSTYFGDCFGYKPKKKGFYLFQRP